jgi:replication-associated recombination protein RarA
VWQQILAATTINLFIKGHKDMSFETKYAPTTISDLIITDPNTLHVIQQFAAGLLHGNILLHGPFGTGKSTTARLMLEPVIGDRCFYGKEQLPIYSGSTLSSDFERLESEYNCQSPSIESPGYVIIEEVDQMSKQNQLRLRAYLDERSWRKVVMTTNNPHHIDQGLVSRSREIEIPACDPASWFTRAKFILASEGIVCSSVAHGMTCSPQDLQSVLSKCPPDARKILQALELLVQMKRSQHQPALIATESHTVAPRNGTMFGGVNV